MQYDEGRPGLSRQTRLGQPPKMNRALTQSQIVLRRHCPKALGFLPPHRVLKDVRAREDFHRKEKC